MLVDRHMRHNAVITANISVVTALHNTGTTGKDEARNLWCVWLDPGPFIAPHHSLSGAHKQPRAPGGPRGASHQHLHKHRQAVVVNSAGPINHMGATLLPRLPWLGTSSAPYLV